MRILVTGANGFIGSKLCLYLIEAGHEVRRAVRVLDGFENTVEISESTSSDKMREALRDVECVIHLAAQVHILGKSNPDRDAAYRETNVQFPRRLALIAHEVGVRRFVFISSIKVCGEASDNGPLKEEGTPHPIDSYAISKWEAEQALREVEKKSGLEVVIVRPPLVYGEGVKANFLTLLSAIRFGIPLPFSQLRNRRSFLYLPNLVSALTVCAVHPEAAGETFHVSDGESVALSRLVGALAETMSCKARVFPCPKWLLMLVGKLTGKYQQVGSLINALEVDDTKIRSLLGWSPPYTFQQGIKKTAEWYVHNAKASSKRNKKQEMRKPSLKGCQLCAVDFTLKHLLLPLVDGMVDEGWHVTSVCSDGKYVSEMRQRGYRIFPAAVSRDIFNVAFHLRSVWKLYRLFRRERFDVLHVHTPIAALLGRIAGKLAGVPLIIYTAHGFYFHDEMPKFKYRFYVLLEKLSGSLTDLIFTQSSEDADVAVAEGIAKPENVVVIGNGINVDLFTPACVSRKSRMRATLGIPEDAYVVGVVSRLVREKGLAEFLEAAVELGRRFQKVHFLLVGERLISDHDFSIERELQEAQQKLGSRLVAVGYRADVADLLGAMDAFCLPSYREGMPRSIIEAMMMGLPVVATNIRGSREEVVDGETGLLVPTHSSAALVQAFERLITEMDLSHCMGQSGRQRALELYDERRVVTRQVDIIKSRFFSV